MPCSSADIRGEQKRGSAPPARTSANPGRRERLGGGGKEEGRERRARISVPGALVGRGGAAASNRKLGISDMLSALLTD